VNIIETLQDILVPLVAIGLAEMGDKTQLSILLLSSRTKQYLRLLLGTMLAFLLVDGFAILVGAWVTTIIPVQMIKLIAGIVFVIFGILILMGSNGRTQSDMSPRNVFVSGFSMIFLSEWGDKTQIASALFASEYNPWMVLIGVMTAFTILSIMAIYLGRFISGRIDRRLIAKVAGTAFILIGLSFILSSISIPYAISLFDDFI
jgi:putative Ca2+/H+ antiporter (TMEM165/GDT1 family)